MGKNTEISQVKIFDLPKIEDPRGNLSFIEEELHIPFIIQRSYWIYDVPGGQVRGSHSFKQQQELIVAISGSFEVLLDDGKNKKIVRLNRPDFGLLVVPGIWRELFEFSSGSVCLVLASMKYTPDDYIRDYEEFKTLKL